MMPSTPRGPFWRLSHDGTIHGGKDCRADSRPPFAQDGPGSLPIASAAIGASTAVSNAWRTEPSYGLSMHANTCLARSGIRPAGSCRLYQAEQALRDDLPCLLNQFVNDLTGRLDRADQAHALVRQQIHRIDVATRLTIRRGRHEAQNRHRLAADDGVADHLLVRPRFLASGLLPEPLRHKGGPQRPVRGVWPAVAEQNGSDRALLVCLQQPLLVVGMGTRFGAGQKPST